MDHDFRVVEFTERFDEFKSVPTESIAVGDNNFVDISAVDEFQKGLKVFAFVVETGTNVFVSLMVWVRFLEDFDLSIEVPRLL